MIVSTAGNDPAGRNEYVLLRVGVGLGEAGIAPGLAALVADRFAASSRTGAMSLISAGTNFGLLLSFFGGGLMMQHYGWRAAFLAAGVASGLLIGLIISWYLHSEASSIRKYLPNR